jgi:hypothetical protein
MYLSLLKLFHNRAKMTSLSFLLHQSQVNERVVYLGLSFGIMTLEGFGNEMKQALIFACNISLVSGNLVACQW